jgi:hypothetical protein
VPAHLLLENRNRNKNKLAMTARLGPQTEKLFTIISNYDWDEKKVELSSFMKRFMEDDKAMNTVS